MKKRQKIKSVKVKSVKLRRKARIVKSELPVLKPPSLYYPEDP